MSKDLDFQTNKYVPTEEEIAAEIKKENFQDPGREANETGFIVNFDGVVMKGSGTEKEGLFDAQGNIMKDSYSYDPNNPVSFRRMCFLRSHTLFNKMFQMVRNREGDRNGKAVILKELDTFVDNFLKAVKSRPELGIDVSNSSVRALEIDNKGKGFFPDGFSDLVGEFRTFNPGYNYREYSNYSRMM